VDGAIHFWCPDALAAATIGWDPDAEPARLASGVGHVLLELAVRLRGRGVEVALGERSPTATRLVVAAAGPLRKDRRQLQGALRAVAAAAGRVVLIRSDTPLAWHLPVRPTREVVSRQALADAPHRVWLPQLPQRGLRPRTGPLTRIGTVTIKCNPVTLPEGLRDGSLAAALERDGVRLWVDMPAATDGSDQTWHDFASADAVLCTRAGDAGEWLEAKPATKLVNAWAAGCVPLAAREAAYLELGRDGTDVVFLDDVAELPAVVARLNADSAALARLAHGVEDRQREFAPARVLQLWHDLLDEAAATPPSRRRAAQAKAAAERVRLSRLGAHLALVVRLRLGRARGGA
jgi:hypothetical protein